MELLYTPVLVNGVKTKALVEQCGNVSYISSNFAAKNGWEVKKNMQGFINHQGLKRPRVGYVSATIKNGSKVVDIELEVIENGLDDVIIGYKQFVELDREQVNETHIEVVEFASKAFPTGKNYSVVLASGKCSRVARMYFCPQKVFASFVREEFILFTDHSAFVHLFTKKDPSPLYLRWIDLLQMLTFKGIYRKGEENVLADALSRRFESSSMSVEDLIVKNKVDPPENERIKIIEDFHSLGHFGKQQLFLKCWNEAITGKEYVVTSRN